MIKKETEPVRPAALARALDLMAQSLDMIDHNGVPGDIGAHLDLALVRLRAYLEI